MLDLTPVVAGGIKGLSKPSPKEGLHGSSRQTAEGMGTGQAAGRLLAGAVHSSFKAAGEGPFPMALPGLEDRLTVQNQAGRSSLRAGFPSPKPGFTVRGRERQLLPLPLPGGFSLGHLCKQQTCSLSHAGTGRGCCLSSRPLLPGWLVSSMLRPSIWLSLGLPRDDFFHGPPSRRPRPANHAN